MVKKKPLKSSLKKTKTERESPDEEENGRPSTSELDEIHEAIIELRERGKKEKIDFNKELRKIQDHISDVKGEKRRPATAAPEKEQKKSKKRVEIASEDEEENSDSSAGEDEDEEEDPDKETKEILNRRLSTIMLLCLSFESDNNFPRDFYEKLAEPHKFDEVVSPITKDERKLFNKLLKEKKSQAKKRIEECLS